MDILSNFGDTLDSLMFERGLNASTLAQEVNICHATLSNYLNKDHLPTLDNLIVLADFFNCTTDFLLGLEADNSSSVFYECPPFHEQLKILKQQKPKLSWTKFIESAKITSSCFYDWKKGKFLPAVESVVKLAEYLDCSVDFVIGRAKH